MKTPCKLTVDPKWSLLKFLMHSHWWREVPSLDNDDNVKYYQCGCGAREVRFSPGADIDTEWVIAATHPIKSKKRKSSGKKKTK